MVKIRRFKKLIKEGMESIPIKKREYDIYDTMAKLINQKKLDLQKLYSHNLENSGITIPLHKLNAELIVDTNDGKKIKINPAEIASYCEYVKTQAISDNNIGIIISKFQKPLLWTLSERISTAACDGLRIVFNPVFAYKLISMGKDDFLNNRAKGDSKKYQSNRERNQAVSKYFLYVLMHEAYHALYRHIEAGELKEETSEGKNAELANVAMDAEINRDIERQFMQFSGCTNTLNGVFDPRFPVENWEEIFDAYFYKNMELPAHEESSNDQNWSEPKVKIKPKEQREMDGPQPPPPPGPDQEFSDDYKKGWSDAIDDVTSSKVDPKTYNPKSGSSDYDQGYNDCMSQIKEGVENGIDLPKNPPQGGNNNGPGLRPIPWDIKQTPQGPGGDPGLDPDNDNNKNDIKDPGGNPGNDNKNNIKDPGGNPGNDNNKNNITDPGGNPGNDDNKNGIKDPGNLPTKMDDKSEDYQRGYQDELNKELEKMGIHVPNVLDPNSFNGSSEEMSGREQARKDIKKIEKDLSSQIEDEMSQDKDFDKLSQEYEGAEVKTSTSDHFGGVDMISREEMAKIAKEQGQPYTNEELACDITEVQRKYQEKVLNNINQPDLKRKLEGIKNELDKREAIIPDWRSKLKHLFTEAMKTKTIPTRRRKLLGQDWRLDRALPYAEKPIEEILGANIFYLIDSSGSMTQFGGDNIWYQIFKEIITLEKSCKILKSARAYFNDNIISPKDVEMWDLKTSKDKILDKLKQTKSPGGTDIPGNVVSVTKLPKPYYFHTIDKHTLIMVFTDGEDNFQNFHNTLKLIPIKIRKDIIFTVFNSKSFLLDLIATLTKCGIPHKNIIAINTDSIKIK